MVTPQLIWNIELYLGWMMAPYLTWNIALNLAWIMAPCMDDGAFHGILHFTLHG